MTSSLENDKEDGKQTPDAGNNCPQGYFFKGYLAWSLWGHISIVDTDPTTMRSSLLGNGNMEHFIWGEDWFLPSS
jgi:hypothetical protein